MKPTYSSRKIRVAQQATCFLHLFDAFNFFDAYIQQADRRAVEPEETARHRLAHQGEFDKLNGVGADRRTDIEDNAVGAQCRPDRGDGRA